MVLLVAVLSLLGALTAPLTASATVSEQSNRLPGVKQIETYPSHTCALLENSEVRCWGNNRGGKLGDGTKEDSSVPVAVKAIDDPNANLTRVKALSSGSGNSHTCVLMMDTRVACWGVNSQGQLGIPADTEESLTPVIVQGVGGRGDLKGVKQLVGSTNHTCALLANSSVACWGWNFQRVLGTNAELEIPERGSRFTSTPLVVQGTDGRGQLRNVTELSATFQNNCALLNNGRAVCWGSNFYGQLGAGTTEGPSSVPIFAVDADGQTMTDIKQVASGLSTCVLLRNGNVDCWGLNLYGGLGDGTTTDSVTPVAVKARDGRQGRLSQVNRLVEGLLLNTCALLTTGRAVCWGSNSNGALGVGSEEPFSTIPITVKGVDGRAELTGVTQISPGDHGCALQKRNQVTCWGWNRWGQVGDGTLNNSSVPLAIQVS